MGRRTDLEDKLVALLEAGLPRSTPVISNPLGLKNKDQLKSKLKQSLVIVTYARGRGKEQLEYPYTQEQSLTWSIFCIAKSYRSSGSRGEAALDLLDRIEDAVNGQEIEGAMKRIRVESDRVVPLDQNIFPASMAYEILVSIDTNFERTL